jgi:hypothetical protein
MGHLFLVFNVLGVRVVDDGECLGGSFLEEVEFFSLVRQLFFHGIDDV